MRRLTRADIVTVSALIAAGALGIGFAFMEYWLGVVIILCVVVTGSAFFVFTGRHGFRKLLRASAPAPATSVSSAPQVPPRPQRAARPVSETERIPTLSIVMPVYNVAPYLESALLSVLYQEFQDFELIVIDDASTDASAAIIDMYAELDSRIRVLALTHNSLGGAGVPSNMGIHAARGKYLGFADSDDVVMRGAFARLVEIAEREDADLVIGSFTTFSDEDRVVSPAYDLPRVTEIPRDQLISATSNPELLELSPVPWRKLYKRSFLQKFNIEYPEGDYFFEDNPLHWSVLSLADRVVLTDEIVSQHRMGREGQTMGSMEHRKGAFAHHLTTALQSVLRTSGERREALLAAYIDRLYGSRWVIRQQNHPGAQAMLARRFATLFDRAVAAGARIPLAMRRTVGSYRGSYPAHDLTVVVNAYSCSSKIKRTLDSILSIRRLNCDILIVDDGSTDNTLAVLREYESAHANVHVFTQPHRGRGRARNSVIPLITGTYALFIEAGDLINAEPLVACVREADQQAFDLMFVENHETHTSSPAPEHRDHATTSAHASIKALPHQDAAEQMPVAWNRLVRSAFLHDANIFFGGSPVYGDILFHWQTVASASTIGHAPLSVVTTTKFTRVRIADELVATRGDALHDALWFTHRRVSAVARYRALHSAWVQFASGVLTATKAQLPMDLRETFDAQSSALMNDFARYDAVTETDA